MGDKHAVGNMVVEDRDDRLLIRLGAEDLFWRYLGPVLLVFGGIAPLLMPDDGVGMMLGMLLGVVGTVLAFVELMRSIGERLCDGIITTPSKTVVHKHPERAVGGYRGEARPALQAAGRSWRAAEVRGIDIGCRSSPRGNLGHVDVHVIYLVLDDEVVKVAEAPGREEPALELAERLRDALGGELPIHRGSDEDPAHLLVSHARSALLVVALLLAIATMLMTTVAVHAAVGAAMALGIIGLVRWTAPVAVSHAHRKRLHAYAARRFRLHRQTDALGEVAGTDATAGTVDQR